MKKQKFESVWIFGSMAQAFLYLGDKVYKITPNEPKPIKCSLSEPIKAEALSKENGFESVVLNIYITAKKAMKKLRLEIAKHEAKESLKIEQALETIDEASPVDKKVFDSLPFNAKGLERETLLVDKLRNERGNISRMHGSAQEVTIHYVPIDNQLFVALEKLNDLHKAKSKALKEAAEKIEKTYAKSISLAEESIACLKAQAVEQQEETEKEVGTRRGILFAMKFIGLETELPPKFHPSNMTRFKFEEEVARMIEAREKVNEMTLKDLEDAAIIDHVFPETGEKLSNGKNKPSKLYQDFYHEAMEKNAREEEIQQLFVKHFAKVYPNQVEHLTTELSEEGNLILYWPTNQKPRVSLNTLTFKAQASMDSITATSDRMESFFDFTLEREWQRLFTLIGIADKKEIS